MPEERPEVTVTRVGNAATYDPPGFTKVPPGGTMTWKHEGKSLQVDFEGSHPFTSNPPFKAGGDKKATATVRGDARPGDKFPCRLTLDDLPPITVNNGVIIDD